MAQVSIRITGVPFDQIAPKIQKGLDLALAKTLTDQREALEAANPRDTGRMASSWRIGKNESLEPEQADYAGPITFEGNWYISNNLPYSQPVAALGGYPASWGGQLAPSIPSDWFTSIANQTGYKFLENYRKQKL